MVLRRTPGRPRMSDRRRTMTKADRRTQGRQAMPGRPLTGVLPPMRVRRAIQVLRPMPVRRAMQAATTAMAPRRMPAARAIPVRRSTPGRPRGTKPGTDRPTASRPAIPVPRAMATRATATTAIRAVREIRAERPRRRRRHRRLRETETGNGPPGGVPPGDPCANGNGNPCNGNNGNSGGQGNSGGGTRRHRRRRRRRLRLRLRGMGPETDRLAAFRPATHVPRAMAILAMAITGIRAVREMRAE